MQSQLCQTCFEGSNDETGDEIYPWGPCDFCGARALAEYQLADLETIEAGSGQAIIASCLGSRKTGTTAAFVNRHRGVWLGVVPLHTMKQWKVAIEEFSPNTIVHTIKAGNKTGFYDLMHSTPDAVHLIGYELFRRHDWKQYKGIDGAFLDEAHRASGYGTMTAKALFKLNTAYRLALSGTPAQNALQKLWNLLHWIWWGNNDHKTKLRLMRYKVLHRFTDGTAGWLNRHFHITKETIRVPKTGREVEVETIHGEKVFHSVVDEIPTYIQHLEEERCCEFHPNGVNASLPPIEEPRVIEVEMTATQAKVYKQVTSGAPVLWLDSTDPERDEEGVYLGDNELVSRLRARQVALAVPSLTPEGDVVFKPEAVSTKTEALLDLLEDISDEPVVVYTHSQIFARMVTDRINKKFGAGFAFCWTGLTPQDERDHVKDVTFGREGGPTVIVATQASIGEGTDGLQLVCRREVWLSWDDNMMLNTQTVGRLRRTGQRRRIQRWDIVTAGTLEVRQIRGLKRRKNRLDASLKANV